MKRLSFITISCLLVILSLGNYGWAASKAQSFQFLLSQVRSIAGPLNGGTATFYEAGTTTPKTIWLDRDKNSEATNPYTLDANGTAQLFGDGVYKVVIKNEAGSTVYTRDGINIVDPLSAGVERQSADFASLNAAITEIGSTPTTLEISTSGFPMTGNATVPSTLALKPVYPGSIDRGAYTLTINSPFSPPPYQVFTGSGAVVFGPEAVTEIFSEWWGAKGDGSTDDTVALQAAFTASQWRVLRLIGKYKITSQIGIDPTKGYHVKGNGYDPNGNNSSAILNYGTGIAIAAENLGVANDIPIVLENFGIFGNASSSNGLSMINIHGLRANKLWIANNGTNGIFLSDGWANKITECVVTHNKQHGIVLQNRCNNVTILKTIVNGNGQTNGYSNINLNANVGFENLNVNIIGCDISYAGDSIATDAYNISVTNSWGVNIHGCYSELAPTSLLYVGANTKNVSVKGNYFQDGSVISDSGTNHEFTDNTFNAYSVAAGLNITAASASMTHVARNEYLNGATETLSGGIGNHKEMFSTANPGTGGPLNSYTFEVGDIAWNPAVTNGNGGNPVLGWVCTTAGTPGTWTPFGGQGATQADSTAGDVATLKADFNTLLAKLRASGLLAP